MTHPARIRTFLFSKLTTRHVQLKVPPGLPLRTFLYRRIMTVEKKNDHPSGGGGLLAVVEGGGTTFQVAVVDPKDRTLLHRASIDSGSGDPHNTLAACATFFQQHRPSQGYQALGVATFGPVGLRKGTPEYGCILRSSPKATWRNVDLLTPLIQACQGPDGGPPLPVQIDTDVNAPALAEYLHWRNHPTDTNNNTIESVAYVTVGTGVGVGLVVNGEPVHGMMHPEGGHLPIQPLPNDRFPGYSWGRDSAPFRGIHTVEGVTCSVALTERWHMLHPEKGDANEESSTSTTRSVLATLEDDDEIWDHSANALACLCASLLLLLSIDRIVLGGGILQRNGLLSKIKARTIVLLNGYLELPKDDLSSIITTSVFGTDAGLMGAVVLAEQALQQSLGTAKADSTSESAKKDLQQQAFGHGLWHGILIGAIGAGLIFKYAFGGGRGNRSSSSGR